MPAALLKQQFESLLGGHLDWQSRPAPECVPTGVPSLDDATGGLPRGSLTEIFGPASSGRTSLLLSILAQATARQSWVSSWSGPKMKVRRGLGVVLRKTSTWRPAIRRLKSRTATWLSKAIEAVRSGRAM